MFTVENLKVFGASLIGFGAPSANWLIEVGEPLMKVLVLAGQFGVAVVTIVYIYYKCRGLARSDRRRKK